MKLLILGGTIFLGRHLVDAALARNHTITLFNRGQHNPDLYAHVEKLRGDRDGDLAALAGRRWDAVIDTCGYIPRIVQASAQLLADSVEHYTFISSLSVYADFSQPGIDEGAPVGTLDDPTVEAIDGETYGPLKALCEQVVEQTMPGRVLTIRPGLIVGPHDVSDRFTYWPVHVARGGKTLAPSRPDFPTEIIDVRDLAEWTIRMVEQQHTGIFNATGPAYPLTLGDVLETSRQVCGSDAEFVWASEKFLTANEVQPWTQMPLWVGDDPEMAGFSSFDCDKAMAAGLSFRPLADTIADTLKWAATRLTDHEWRAGLTPAREAQLLAAWAADA